MTVRMERRGRVVILTLDRPEVRNAIDPATAAQLSQRLDEAEGDPEVWVVILTAAGDRAFCAGMDLKAFSQAGVEGMAVGKGGFAGITRRRFPKPLIAAVNGHAVAGGFEIVLACDLVVSGEHATFALPEVKRGLYAAGGGLFRLPERIPMALALELALTGDALSAARAHQLGLINAVVPKGKELEEALRLAERLCESAPLAVRATKRLLYESRELTDEERWALIPVIDRELLSSEDVKEGSRAFLEKRKPRWTGR